MIINEKYMDKISLAWAAGFLDGEGSFQIKRVQRGEKRNYQLWITCGMSKKESNKPALHRLKLLFNGNVCESKPSEWNNFGSIYWTVVSQQALKALKKLVPFLVIKQQQAYLLIEFQEKYINRVGKRSGKDSDAKRLKQEEYFYQVRELNSKNKLRLQRLNEVTSQEDATV